MFKYVICAVLLSLAVLQGFGQRGMIKGKLVDSASGAPLNLATVTVFNSLDTSIITYRLSNPEGGFQVTSLPLNREIRIIVSFTGYAVFRKNIFLANDKAADLGMIKMAPADKSLDEVLVFAERPPVTVNKDTIEFNASSFRTLPDALVEDLLRKLPGVEVDRNGDIRVNGKTVNRILVDGKNFFGNDPKMATRNLPANAIEKVQVMDDQEELDRSTDGNVGRIGKVINLRLRKNIKKGWFGKAYAGGGTKDRNEIGGIANIYRDTLQLSLLAYSNNINRGSFSIQDVVNLGGFNRSGINSMSVARGNGSEGFSLNGISFGGQDVGISRSTGAGLNVNHAPGKKFNLYAQYFLANTSSVIESTNNTQQFTNDTIITNRTTSNGTNKVIGQTANVGVNFHPTEFTHLAFRAGGVLNTVNGNDLSVVSLLNNKLGTLSQGNVGLMNQSNTGRYDHELLFMHKFGRDSREIINLRHELSYQDNSLQQITQTSNQYYYPVLDTLQYEQLRKQSMPSLSVMTRIDYSNKLSDGFLFRISAYHDYSETDRNISTLTRDSATMNYIIDDDLTNGLSRHQNIFYTGFSLSATFKQLMITGGMASMWQSVRDDYKQSGIPFKLGLFNVLPSLALNWKGVSLQYSMSVTAPSVNFLTPVPDNSNPYSVVYGNPALNASERHLFSSDMYKYIAKHSTSINYFIRWTITNNDIIYNRSVDSKGVQSVIPVNADGTKELVLGGGYSRDFKRRQNFTFSFRLSPSVNYNKSKLIFNDNSGTVAYLRVDPRVSVGFNWNDRLEIRPSYSLILSRSEYSIPAYRDLHVLTNSFLTDIILRWPSKLIWQSNLDYRYNSDAAPGLPRENILWNAAVAVPFLRNDRGQLKCSVYDILNRNNSFTRYVEQNNIVDRQINVLKRYVMLTFTYSFRNLAESNRKGQRLFLF